MQILETKHLLVTKPTLTDFEKLYLLLSDPEVMRYIDKPRTRAVVYEQLEKMIQHYDKHGFSAGHVFEKTTGEFVGRAGLIYLALNDRQEDIEMAYALHKKFWGRGYAPELAKAFIRWGFNNISSNYFVAVIHIDNERSRRVLEKVGMRYLGQTICYDSAVAKYVIYKNHIDYAQIELVPATLDDYSIMENLARLYAYDISEYFGHESGWEIQNNGLYSIGLDFKQYFESPDIFPFFIKYNESLAGFAIIDRQGSDAAVDFNMAQFFVLRTYKSQGIGKYIASQCFAKFPGIWEIMVLPGNEAAYRFWRALIKEYTANNYTEYTKPVARFNNKLRNFFRFDTNFDSSRI